MISCCFVGCIARPLALTALSGYPVILICSRHPTSPVSWTFQHSTDSKMQNIVVAGSVVIDYAKRFGILDTSLIIYEVQSGDAGLYNCSDGRGDVLTHTVTVLGKINCKHFTLLRYCCGSSLTVIVALFIT